jgi:nucleotide-binding universal stress UspA family protein
MNKMKILIPTDFSLQAEYAWILARKINEKIPSEIHFVHVLNVPETVEQTESGNITTCGDISPASMQRLYDDANLKLKEFKEKKFPTAESHILLGKITERIVEFARSKKFDVIIMGTKGEEKFRDKISGTEAQHVVRKSDIPVLTVRCDRSSSDLTNILFVHDFNVEEKFDISLMKKIQSAFGSKVILLHIFNDEKEELKKSAIEQKMREYADKEGLSNYEIHFIRDRDVELEVFHFDQMHSTDLVCIGTHGKGSLIYASIAEKLVNHMFKPLLTFRIYDK